jgi:hypothetical protein
MPMLTRRLPVLCNGELATYRPGNRCHIPTKASPNSLPSDLNDISDHLYALNDLQLKRDQRIDPLSLRCALRSLFLSLPREAQQKVLIFSGTHSDALFGDNDHNLFTSLLGMRLSMTFLCCFSIKPLPMHSPVYIEEIVPKHVYADLWLSDR